MQSTSLYVPQGTINVTIFVYHHYHGFLAQGIHCVVYIQHALSVAANVPSILSRSVSMAFVCWEFSYSKRKFESFTDSWPLHKAKVMLQETHRGYSNDVFVCSISRVLMSFE